MNSICGDVGTQDAHNEVLYYVGEREELEQILSVALPRSEAAQIPAIAFTKATGECKLPCAVTFKAQRFSIINWNASQPVWCSLQADLTSSFGDILDMPGQEAAKVHFDQTTCVYVLQIKAVALLPKPATWRGRPARKRRRNGWAKMTAI